jgi:hypothetical protein
MGYFDQVGWEGYDRDPYKPKFGSAEAAAIAKFEKNRR